MAQSIQLSLNNENKLDLGPGEEIEADIFEGIEWSITDQRISSFRIKRKKGSPGIFILPPPGNHVGRWKGVVHPFSGGRVYRYSIFWKDSSSNEEQEHDPIISIKPSLTRDPVLKTAAIVITTLLAILTLKSLFRKRK